MMAVKHAILDDRSGPHRSGRMITWFRFHESGLDDSLTPWLKHSVVLLKLEHGCGMVDSGIASDSISDPEGLTVLRRLRRRWLDSICVGWKGSCCWEDLRVVTGVPEEECGVCCPTCALEDWSSPTVKFSESLDLPVISGLRRLAGYGFSRDRTGASVFKV